MTETVDLPQAEVREILVEEPVDVRPKNQVTVPKSVAEALGITPGDRLMFVVQAGEPNQFHVYRMPKSFAGIAPHAYGDAMTSVEYIRAEREAWGE